MSKTIEQLESEYEKLKTDVVDIQTQLAQKKPVGRVADGDYAAWRDWSGRAKGALRHKLNELREAKIAVKDARRRILGDHTGIPSAGAFGDLTSEHGLIRASYVTLRSLKAEVEFESEEEALLGSLEAWLAKNGVAQ